LFEGPSTEATTVNFDQKNKAEESAVQQNKVDKIVGGKKSWLGSLENLKNSQSCALFLVLLHSINKLFENLPGWMGGPTSSTPLPPPLCEHL
jgi:hypothetical protein